MPVRRTKACDSCRVAKARCSLAVPCSRCAKREIECRYSTRDTTIRRTDGLRSLKPLLKLGKSTAETDENASMIVAPDMPQGVITAEIDGEVAIVQAPSTTIPLHEAAVDPSDLFEAPGSLDSGLQYARSDAFSVDPFVFAQHDLDAFDPSINWLSTPSSSKTLGPQLSQRSRTLQQGSLTAKMVFVRLSNFTHMLAEGKTLPPFIYPPCALGSTGMCPPGSRHRCLPGMLAVCANLTQMFHSHLPGCHGFVWQQICAHLRQIELEFETYEMFEMLQAMQAAVVYGILCSQCTESVSMVEAAWLVEMIENFGERLYEMCVWGLDATHVCGSRIEWVLTESLRRIYAVLFLIDILLQTDGPAPASDECPEFFGMPLPCTRDLWQSHSDTRWQKLYQEDIESRRLKGHGGLLFRDLLSIKQAPGDDELSNKSVGWEHEISTWCENADDLSMLLWMTLTIERS